jgi:16S rRNA (cytidine1402-2'-O)-methyltransferase
LALNAARDAAASQHYPQGALYVVATPIGNLADISLRSLHVLQLADVVACEDTRHTQALLRAYGIDKAASQLLAVHQHNESEAAQAVVERLRQGQRVAYASDAGTPAVSDPGARLVAAVREAGLRCVPLPGASSVTAALSVAGAMADDGAFVFAGFLPAKTGEGGGGGGGGGGGRGEREREGEG